MKNRYVTATRSQVACGWVAMWGRGEVHRYTPQGRLDQRLTFPADKVTSCTFGGADLTDLYVTSAAVGLSPRNRARHPHAGAVFVVRAAGQGLESPRFSP